MKISMRTDYALRALFHLVKHGQERVVPVRELAAENDIPIKFLEQIMAELKQQGWVVSTAGKRGGYKLGLEPDELTVGQVVRHFEGVLAPIACVSVTQYVPCSQEPVCNFRRLFLEIRNEIAHRMDRTTLAMLVASPRLTYAELREPQFYYADGI